MHRPDEQSLLTFVRGAIADTIRGNADAVQPDSRLGMDLGMESLDYVDLQFRLESEFGVRLLEGGAIQKLEEIYGPERLAMGGRLTSLGSRVLRLRLPEVSQDRLVVGQPMQGIEGWFTVRTWVRTVGEILDARPKACPGCGSESFEVRTPGALTCGRCQNDVPCPDAEACLVAWVESHRHELAA